MVHEMITDSESSAVIKAADPKMRRSAVVEDRKDSGGKEDDLRISEQAWLVEWEVPSLDRLRQRLEALFRLKTLSERDAELYQVANYGLSGQYNSHHDAVLMGVDKNHKMQRHVFNINNGDRIATVSTAITHSLGRIIDWVASFNDCHISCNRSTFLLCYYLFLYVVFHLLHIYSIICINALNIAN